MRSTNISAPTIADYGRRLANYGGAAVNRARTVRGVGLLEKREGPLVSIITVAFNAVRTVRRTIDSVLAQTYPHVEYIVIDGGSTDGTIDVLREYDRYLSYWHTGRDQGISDAFNLGIAASSGEFVALVNADDWMGPEQVHLAVEGLVGRRMGFVFGQLKLYEIDGRLRAVMLGDRHYRKAIRRGMPRVNHPSVVVARTAYEVVGLYSLQRRIAMDYDWLLRAELKGIHGHYLPGLVAHMQVGGTCYRDWVGGLREVRATALEQGMNPLSVNVRHISRLTRGWSRVLLRYLLPRRVVDKLHRLINTSYNPVEDDSNVQ